jgi:TolA-binding protein
MDHLEVPEESSAISKAIQQTHEISGQAMRDQIKFMQDRITAIQKELEEKELTIRTVEMEKRENARKFDALESQHFELQERLSIAETKAEELERSN